MLQPQYLPLPPLQYPPAPQYPPPFPPGPTYSQYPYHPAYGGLPGFYGNPYASASTPYGGPAYGHLGVGNGGGIPMVSYTPAGGAVALQHPPGKDVPLVPTVQHTKSALQQPANNSKSNVTENKPIEKAIVSPEIPRHSESTKQVVSATMESGSDSEGDLEEDGICTELPGTDKYNWPNSKQVRKFASEDEARPNNDQAKWQFRSHGKSNWNRHATKYSVATERAKTSKCLGVDICPSDTCACPYKPKTDPSVQQRQIANGCSLCGSAPLIHHECDARCHRYMARDIKTNEEYFRWEHEGTHNHPRPPATHLSATEAAQLNAQVMRGGVNTTVHALRTGDLNPGSVPLPDIAPMVASPSIARYFVAKSQACTGMTNTAQKASTGGATIKQMIGLNKELGETFLIFSQLHGQGMFMFRTEFMNTVLEATVDEWVAVDMDIRSRHGFVTDGNHSFFKDGVLLSTCAFSQTLKACVPVLFTLIFGEDTAHHHPHFQHLFDGVMVKIHRDRLEFKKEYLLNVMDFSLAQRNAHAEEYAIAVAKTIPGFSSLSADAQAAQMAALCEEAKSLEVGCDFHFWAQATRVKETAALVDPTRVSDFNYILRKMILKKTSSDEFDLLVARFRREFPDAVGWLSWWIQSSVMGMIFPAKSTIDPAIIDKVPSTSNAAEHGHSLLNHAVGSGNELMEGVHKLYLHAKQFHSEYNSIKSPREHRAPKKVKFFENDGRAPDTFGAIKELDPASNMGLEALARLPLFTQSFKWSSPNSCFWDNGIELFFRTYVLWKADTRTKFRGLLPGDSFLMVLTSHFDRRLKLITSNKKKDVNAQSLLDLALSELQKALRARIFEKWHPDCSPTGHHSALSWIQDMVEDYEPCFEAQGYFALYSPVKFSCPASHQFSQIIDKPKAIVYPHCAYITSLRDHLRIDGPVGLGDYLSNIVLLLEDQALEPCVTSPRPCTLGDCTAHAPPKAVQFSWPQILAIRSNLANMKPTAVNNILRFDETFKITDSSDAEVVYTLVGRVLHKKDHFTVELMLGGVSYTYDDMSYGSKLRRSKKGTHPLQKRTSQESYYVYCRTSELGVKMEENFLRYEETCSPGSIPKKPLSVSSFHSSDPDSSIESTSSKSTIYNNLISSDDEVPLRLFAPISSMGPTGTNEAGPSTSSAPLTALDQALADWDAIARGTPSTVPHNAPVVEPPPAFVIPSCNTCGLQGPAAWSTIICHMCSVECHTACTSRFLPEDYAFDLEFKFCCPQCRYAVNGRWDTLIDDFATNTLASVGSIIWPVDLYDITSEEDIKVLYKRDTLGIEKALHGASTALSEILDGTRHHPIMSLMQSWMSSLSSTLSNNEEHHACIRVLLQLVVLRQYLKLKPADDAEIYELAQILTDSEYTISTEDDVAARAHVQRLLTIHEQAFYCNRANILGNSKLDPTPQITASVFASEDPSMKTHLLKGHGQIQRTVGDVPVEDPVKLVRILTEDGAPYIIGTLIHQWKDDMALSGSMAKPVCRPLPTRDPKLGPAPYPFTPNSPKSHKMPPKGDSNTFRIMQLPIVPEVKPKQRMKTQSELPFIKRPLPPSRPTRKVTMDQRVPIEKREAEEQEIEGYEPTDQKRTKQRHLS
ncbi:hypothetical protein DFP72DRAFT_850700 [Ephemerocybe angulata]|uniref:Uncharacterized protein n=1 Tax=Ephemerocybe angulata TaxID=980116 RepID=A0A8H6HSF4_9AGAR|nr:hypothetical protein DFP72DRAFT_850700 [Tulosesus angulatus]